MSRKPEPKPERYLSVAEIAELMQLKHQRKDERRQYVRRLFRKLEKRDGRKYLHRFGPGRGKYHVSLEAIDQIAPWDPGTLSEIRGGITQLNSAVKTLRRQLNGHGSRIGNLERWRKLTERYLAESAGI